MGCALKTVDHCWLQMHSNLSYHGKSQLNLWVEKAQLKMLAYYSQNLTKRVIGLASLHPLHLDVYRPIVLIHL